MRLLNSSTEELTLFVSDNGIPRYAILSHTWGEEEVLFQDMLSPDAKLKKGYKKIKYACEQAQKDHIAWVWVDTYVGNFYFQTSNRRFSIHRTSMLEANMICLIGAASTKLAAQSSQRL
jgi:hypothetical protein